MRKVQSDNVIQQEQRRRRALFQRALSAQGRRHFGGSHRRSRPSAIVDAASTAARRRRSAPPTLTPWSVVQPGEAALALAAILDVQVPVLLTDVGGDGELVDVPRLMAFRSAADVLSYLALTHGVDAKKPTSYTLYSEPHMDRYKPPGGVPLVELRYGQTSVALVTCGYGGQVLTFLNRDHADAVRDALSQIG